MINLTRQSVLGLPGLIAMLMLSACGGAATDAAVAPEVTVDVAPVLNASIARVIRTEALIYPRQQAAIAARIAAPIKKFYVDKGAHVRAGQLLVQLENADIAGALTESRAAQALADANFETAARATVPEEAQKANLDLEAATAGLEAQQSVYDNRVRLFQEGAIAEKDVKDARVALTQARNQFQLSRSRLANLEGFGRDQSLKAASAQRDQATGRLQASEAQLNYSRITSPIDGIVTDRQLYPGETPQAGAPLLTVMDLSQVIARAHVAQDEAAELTVGADATIIAPDGSPIPGHVSLVSPALDPGGTTVEVWVQAPNANGVLKPGAALRLELIARSVPDALVIPQAALVIDSSGAASAIVIDADNKPHRTAVTAGIRDAGRVQITEGLESGQRVVTSGSFELAKLAPEVLAETTVQIQAPKEESEPDDAP